MTKEFFPAVNKQFKELIDNNNNILILTHHKPDADALGSILAMYQLLIKIGKKKVTAVCSDPIPKIFKFLPEANELMDNFSIVKDFIITLNTSEIPLEKVRYNIEGNKVNIIVVPKEGEFKPGMVSFSEGKTNFDLIIVLDVAVPEQLWPIYEDHKEMFEKVTTIGIDHHISNSKFCDYNYVNPKASSTAEMLALFFKNYELGEFVDGDIATCLLTGIIGDTNGFKTSSTTAQSFNIASWLIQKHAKQQEIIKNIFKSQSFTSLKLWGRILSNLKYEKDLKLVRAMISKKDFIETGTSEDDKGKIIDELMTNVTEGDVVLLITEKNDGVISCSLRSINDHVDVNALANIFGGGGHVKAAGFRVKDMDLETGIDYILNGIRNFMFDSHKKNTIHKQPIVNNPTIEQVELGDNLEQDNLKQDNSFHHKVVPVDNLTAEAKPKKVALPVNLKDKKEDKKEDKNKTDNKKEDENLNLKYPEIKNVKDKFHSEDDEMLFIDESGK